MEKIKIKVELLKEECDIKDEACVKCQKRIAKLEGENRELKEAYVGLWDKYATDVREKTKENKTLEEENKKLENKINNLKIIRGIFSDCIMLAFLCFMCAGCLCMLFQIIVDVIMGFQFVRFI